MGDTMLKEYLNNNNISVYKLSEKSGIPYTTLNELANGKKKIEDCKIKTIELLAEALNISIETLLKLLNNKKIILSNSWNDERKEIYYFPKIVENTNYEYQRIHPLKQKQVNNIYNIISKNKKIEKIIIFGSSVSIRCNQKSDMDLAILLKDEYFNKDSKNEISEIIQDATNYDSDIVWLNTIDQTSQLYKNIKNMGVVIYEQTTC